MSFHGDMMTRQTSGSLLTLLTEDFMSEQTNRHELESLLSSDCSDSEHLTRITELIIRSAVRSSFGRELVRALLMRMQVEAEAGDQIPSADRPF